LLSKRNSGPSQKDGQGLGCVPMLEGERGRERPQGRELERQERNNANKKEREPNQIEFEPERRDREGEIENEDSKERLKRTRREKK